MKKTLKIILKISLIILTITIIRIFLPKQKEYTNNNDLTIPNNYSKTEEIIKYEIINQNTNPYIIYYYGIDSFNIKIDNQEYDFINAIKENKITTERIINEMNIVAELNDGGTKIYQNNNNNNKYFINDYRIIKCNTIDGNKDIYIGNNEMQFQDNFCKFNSTESGIKLQIEVLKILNTSKIKVVSGFDEVTKKIVTDKNKINEIIYLISKLEEDTSKITTTEKNSHSLLMYDETENLLSTISIWKSGCIGFDGKKGYFLNKKYNSNIIKDLID